MADLRFAGVRKDYGEVRALRGLDLDVADGELLVLVGPSGCGKTTLISVIAGILDQDGGECEVFGHDFLRMSQCIWKARPPLVNAMPVRLAPPRPMP